MSNDKIAKMCIGMCVCVRVREREHETESEGGREGERARKRERERERECMFVSSEGCACVSACVSVSSVRIKHFAQTQHTSKNINTHQIHSTRAHLHMQTRTA